MDDKDEKVIKNLEKATKEYEDTTKRIIDKLSKKNIKKTDVETQNNLKSKTDVTIDLDDIDLESEIENDLESLNDLDENKESEENEDPIKESTVQNIPKLDIIDDYYYDFNPNIFYADIGVNQYFSKKK